MWSKLSGRASLNIVLLFVPGPTDFLQKSTKHSTLYVDTYYGIGVFDQTIIEYCGFYFCNICNMYLPVY